MDERSVRHLLEIALQHAAKEDAHRITDLYLVLGDHASVTGESIQFHWNTVSRGTLAEGAQLHLDYVALLLRCSDCAQTFPLGASTPTCPVCHSASVVIVSGEGCRLESIQVE